MCLARLGMVCIVFIFFIQLGCLAEQIGDYMIGNGDRLKIMVPSTYKSNLNSDNLSSFGDYSVATYSVIVDNEGNITLPVIGIVKAVDMPLSVLKVNIEDAIEKYLNKKVMVNIVLEYSEIRFAYIWGAVKKPGKYHFVTNFSLFDLLSEANGLTEYGVVDITISRKGIKEYATNQANVNLRFGDIVFVKPLETEIYLAGEFRKPGAYSIDYESVPLQQAVGLGGGLTDKADYKIKIIHKYGKEKLVDFSLEVINTHNVVMVQRGDTLYANTSWWPSWREIGAFLLLSQALFRF